ncbi:MAG: glycerol-3-phosphate 1-O-acyltransferase PlsY [Lactobacillus paragasseri]|uniref:glycerol-3-phosphate 1-O-acyltransferase PlsY n=1 Tax=Lactobacillus paragasseri TaxID=2107999 RepID=UPI0022ABC9C0|nr:glycerol-3-phosphate 1-O-acyltransferase PlsY [Lactobacillus paragasseri]MCZ3494926.1 glycerol-3-phosphate 1-O-acyltransferase PlsY [Lactobacillus gasseri]MCZ3739906.1 glycerol-3-phosphate 1-O-acyltransferase PlsY [Lactobacillus gasseri]MCZ3743365.1 glycerol-3-phosphate 1-O-acyltransferase PlsY [Lactobacillus gasseri]MDU3654418.1 glycerol-3-phosphate 1-O-acyltransferase PlsY [Lactobacillus gasseri]MDU7062876.1 glycerol-3-phosphate 1-O-acyltransferase PlsY [Lactobacillus paragasseri]
MSTLNYLLVFILAYLIGSFPTGVLVGKIFFHEDIRNFGSRNIGTTNSFRVMGPIAGSAVLVIDVLKGTLATDLPLIFHLKGPKYLLLIAGACAILGHTFSIFLKFKGGKAVATSAGVFLGYNLKFFGLCAVVFLPMLFITSYVSLSSLVSIVIIFICSFWFHDIFLTIITGIMMVLLFVRHRSNIKRLINHEENIVPFGLWYWYKKSHGLLNSKSKINK